MLRINLVARALTRPALIAGCERMPLIFLGMFCAIMGITMNFYMIGGALIIALVGIWALRKLAKKDPIMFTIYLSHIKFKKEYPAKPDITRFL